MADPGSEERGRTREHRFLPNHGTPPRPARECILRGTQPRSGESPAENHSKLYTAPELHRMTFDCCRTQTPVRLLCVCAVMVLSPRGTPGSSALVLVHKSQLEAVFCHCAWKLREIYVMGFSAIDVEILSFNIFVCGRAYSWLNDLDSFKLIKKTLTLNPLTAGAAYFRGFFY